MFAHLPPRHQYGLAILGLVGLGVCTYIGARRMQSVAPMTLQTGVAATSPPSTAATLPTQSTEIVVDVAGVVWRPGVVHLKPGARLADAIHAAGGAKPSADLDRINLAAPATDGTQIYVPRKSAVNSQVARSAPPPLTGRLPEPPGGLVEPRGRVEPLKVSPPPSTEPAPTALPTTQDAPPVQRSADPGATPQRYERKAEPTEPININSAGLDALQTLPGVGPATAQKILDYRRDHGPFQSPDDLLNVKGIGPKKLEKMRAYVRV